MPIENAPPTDKKAGVPPVAFQPPTSEADQVVPPVADESHDSPAGSDSKVSASQPVPSTRANRAKTAAARAVEPTSVKAVNEPVNTPDEDEYAYVQMPDGSYRAIRKANIQQIGQISNVDGTPDVPEQDVYVHLANGDVHRVAESKVPGAAGTNAPNGYWEHEGHMHHIVAVYPVETEIKKG